MLRKPLRLSCPSCKADLTDVGIWQKLDGLMYIEPQTDVGPAVQLDPGSSWITDDGPTCGSCDAPLPLSMFSGYAWLLRPHPPRVGVNPPRDSGLTQKLYLEGSDGAVVAAVGKAEEAARPAASLDLNRATTKEVDGALPTLARDPVFVARIAEATARVDTTHRLRPGDARDLRFLPDSSVHLVVTSPPYWTLKEYNRVKGHLAYIEDYREFQAELNRVWSECFRVLVPGGRLVVVVGDVVVSRRSPLGRHKNFPLHADIQVNCEKLGFDNLTPIFWVKIANARFETEGNGAGFLGKPFEPGSIIKNDTEFVLMLRKPGAYRSPTPRTRLLSLIPADNHRRWFSQFWTDIPGESTKDHPAPFPVELAERLVRMFSFVEDVVLDPFAGTGTTMVAAMRAARNSVGVEIDESYISRAAERLKRESASLFGHRRVVVEERGR